MNARPIHVSRLHPHPGNVRGDLGDLTGLAASIRTQGIIQPLVAEPSSTTCSPRGGRVMTVPCGAYPPSQDAAPARQGAGDGHQRMTDSTAAPAHSRQAPRQGRLPLPARKPDRSTPIMATTSARRLPGSTPRRPTVARRRADAPRRAASSPSAADEWLTVDEVCTELKIGRRTFERWRNLGKAPRAVPLAGNGPLRIRRSWLEEWMEDCVEPCP